MCDSTEAKSWATDAGINVQYQTPKDLQSAVDNADKSASCRVRVQNSKTGWTSGKSDLRKPFEFAVDFISLIERDPSPDCP